jgi:hypothetical protein
MDEEQNSKGKTARVGCKDDSGKGKSRDKGGGRTA